MKSISFENSVLRASATKLAKVFVALYVASPDKGTTAA